MSDQQTSISIKLTLIHDPAKGETKRSALAAILAAMADGVARGDDVGGAPGGGHWAINNHGVLLEAPRKCAQCGTLEGDPHPYRHKPAWEPQ
jgi:hypothetical protein